jgi:hypothetical protein
MLTRTRTIIACAAAAIALGSGTTAAFAATATTWTVTPGRSFTAAIPTGSSTTFTDAVTHATSTCGSSSLGGDLMSGSGLPGRGLGSVTTFSVSGCSPSITITTSGFPWLVNAASYNATTGVVSGRIKGIHIAYTGSTITGTCSGVVDGTSDTADNGTVPFRYNNATHRLRLVTGGNLHIYDNTCPGFGSGDPATFTGHYTVSPAQTITSP